jgi:hypothetical protein
VKRRSELDGGELGGRDRRGGGRGRDGLRVGSVSRGEGGRVEDFLRWGTRELDVSKREQGRRSGDSKAVGELELRPDASARVSCRTQAEHSVRQQKLG